MLEMGEISVKKSFLFSSCPYGGDAEPIQFRKRPTLNMQNFPVSNSANCISASAPEIGLTTPQFLVNYMEEQ